jgi:hypothetical protein
VDSIQLSPPQQVLLRELGDVRLREGARDFILNQGFRRDYWVRGMRKLSRLERTEALRLHRVLLVRPSKEVSLDVPGALGEAHLKKDFHLPLVELMADHKVRSLGEIEMALTGNSAPSEILVESMMLLEGTGQVASAQAASTTDAARKQTDRLNRYLLSFARSGEEIGYLASPVTGGGVRMRRFEQLFLLALLDGRRQPRDWGMYAWQVMGPQGHQILKNGKSLATAHENLAELDFQATAFAEKATPILKALQIV